MNQSSEFPSIQMGAHQAVRLITSLLIGSGYYVLPSFDLEAARARLISSPCPMHGTDRCSCQMIILLVYGRIDHPSTLVIYGRDEMTEIKLVDTPQQQSEPGLPDLLYRAILENALSP